MTKLLNAKGLPSTATHLKSSLEGMALNAGDILECVADCPTFEAEMKEWCKDSKKAVLWFRTEDHGATRCQVQI